MLQLVKTIGVNAFRDCLSLTELNIPSGVETIGASAFMGIPHITYNGTATGSPWGALAVN